MFSGPTGYTPEYYTNDNEENEENYRSGFAPESNSNNEEVNAERFPIRAARREATLRERAIMNMLERLRNNNDNNNNGINAERFPNNVSAREAELRMKALEEIEPGNNNYIKPSLKSYIFNRAAANARAAENRSAAAVNMLIRREAAQTAEKARLKAVANAREAEEYARALEEFHAAQAAALAHPRGLQRANATINGVPGRRNYNPEKRKSKRRHRKNKNVTRRR